MSKTGFYSIFVRGAVPPTNTTNKNQFWTNIQYTCILCVDIPMDDAELERQSDVSK